MNIEHRTSNIERRTMKIQKVSLSSCLVRPVIPAKAGIQSSYKKGFWIPACAGMTKKCNAGMTIK
jgi:hypothetical protein